MSVLLNCLNKYESQVDEIKEITTSFKAQIDEKKRLLLQLNKYIEEMEMPEISKEQIKHATPFELCSYCKILRKHYERCVEMNKAGYRAANEKLPRITDLCLYASKYAKRTMNSSQLLSNDLVDLNQFQSAKLLPLKEIYRFMRAIGLETSYFEETYIQMASGYYRRRIKQHCAMTLERLQFGDPELIGSSAPVKKRSMSVEGVVKQIISVRRSISDTPFADIKGSEAPMLLLNILKLYNQCFSQEKSFIESFFGKESVQLNIILHAAQEKIVRSVKSSFEGCRDYRILACCLNQIKLASDELLDDDFIDKIVECLIHFMEAAIEMQAQSILNFPLSLFSLDPLADRFNQVIVEYSSLGIPFDLLVDAYEQRLLKEMQQHLNELEQTALMINCYNHLLSVLPNISNKLYGYLETFSSAVCSNQIVTLNENLNEFEALNARTAVFNEKLSSTISIAVNSLNKYILAEKLQFKICHLICHRIECIYEKLCQDRQGFSDPLQLDTLIPENILKDQLESFKNFFARN